MVGTPQIVTQVSYNTVFELLYLASVFNTSTYDSELDFDEYLAISRREW